MANSNVEIQAQLAQMQQMVAAMEAVSRSVQTQGELLVKVVQSINKEGFGKTIGDLEGLSEAMMGAKKSGMELSVIGQILEKATDSAGFFSKKIHLLGKKELPFLAAAGAGSLKGFLDGLKSSQKLLGSIGSMAKSTGKVFGQFAASIITAPFKMLKGLIHMADQGGSNELQQALEDIRKEFGYLNKTAGGAVVSMSRSMKGELSNTGLSVYRIFGNLAERLKYFLEYAKNVGPAFDTIMHNIGVGGAEALGAYNKALGLTAEGQRAVAESAMAAGKPVNEINRQIANYSLQLSEAFGVTMKEVSRSVGNMMADVTHFGHLTIKELTQAAVYTRKLGLEFKALAGVMDKFMNFDETAEGAARLSQAFGLNIDALELMKAQDPAQKLEMLRKAFFRAGRSVDAMTAQERRYLAQQTGMDDASVRLAFSLRSQGMSYDQITKKGDMAKKKQLTQAEAMVKLSGAIERLVKSGGGDGLGFVDKFFKGFEIGIRRSREFREIMINLRRTLRQTLLAGIETGRAFVKAFPGIKDFFKGLAGFFQPARFRVMLRGVINTFKDFFHDLQGNSPASFKNFSEGLKRNFLAYFDSRSEAGRKFLEGAKAMTRAFIVIITGFLKETIAGLLKGITFIVDLLSGRKKIATLNTNGGFIGELIGNLGNVWEQLKPLGLQLWASLKELFSELFKKLAPYISAAVSTYLVGTITTSLVSGLVKGFGSAVATNAIGPALGGWLKKMFFTQARTQVETLATSATSATSQGAAAAGSAATTTIEATNKAAEAANDSQITMSTIGKMVLISAFIVGGMYLALQAIKDMSLFIKQHDLSLTTMIAASQSMVAAGLVIVAAAGAAKLLSMIDMDPSKLGKTMLGLVAVGAISLAMVGTAWVAVKAMQGFPLTDVAKSVIIMGAMGTFYLAASGIAIAAAAIGAFMILTKGVGAIAILAGLLTLQLIVQASVKGAMGVMREINAFHASPDFAEKAKGFAEVIAAIGSFVGSLAPVLSSLAPSVIDSIFASASTRERSFTKLTEFVRMTGTVVKELINQLLVASANLTPEQVERGKAFGTILQAAAGLAQSLQAPAALFGGSGIDEILNGLETAYAKVELFKQVIRQTGLVLRDLMREVVSMMQSLATTQWNANAAQGVTAITTLLEGFSKVAVALTPKAELVNAISNAISRTGTTRWIESFAQFANTIIHSVVESGMITQIKQVVTGIVGQMAGLSSDQVNRLKAVLPVLSPVMTAISALATTIGELTAQTNTDRNSSPTQLWNAAVLARTRTQAISTFLVGIRDVIPQIIQKLNNLNLTKQQASSIKTASEGLKAVMEAIAMMPSMFKAMTDQTEQNKGLNTHDRVYQVVSSIGLMLECVAGNNESANSFRRGLDGFQKMQLPTGLVAKANTLKNVLEAMKVLPEVFGSLGAGNTSVDIGSRIRGVVGGIATGIMAIASNVSSQGAPSFQEALDRLHSLNLTNEHVTKATRMQALFTSFQGLSDTIAQAGNVTASLEANAAAHTTGRIGQAIIAMVNEVNTFSDELARAGDSVPQANVALRRISGGLGLAGNEVLTIRRNNLNINIPISVTIAGSEMQSMLVNVSRTTTPANAPRLATTNNPTG